VDCVSNYSVRHIMCNGSIVLVNFADYMGVSQNVYQNVPWLNA